MGSNWPAWLDTSYEGKSAMKPLKFGEDGHAIYGQGGSPASLYGENSIIGRSLAVYDDMDYVKMRTNGDIDACCTITHMVTEEGEPDT